MEESLESHLVSKDVDHHQKLAQEVNHKFTTGAPVGVSHNAQNNYLAPPYKQIGAESLRKVPVLIPCVYHSVLILELLVLNCIEVLECKPNGEAWHHQVYDRNSDQGQTIRPGLSAHLVSAEAAREWSLESHDGGHAELDVPCKEQGHEAVPEDLGVELVSPVLKLLIRPVSYDKWEKDDNEELEPHVDHNQHHWTWVQYIVGRVICNIVQLLIEWFLVPGVELKNQLCWDWSWDEIEGHERHQCFEKEPHVCWEVHREARLDENHLQRGDHP